MNETTPTDVYQKLAEINSMLRAIEERRIQNIAETAAMSAVLQLVYLPVTVGAVIYLLVEALL
jgi:hypothetical protein